MSLIYSVTCSKCGSDLDCEMSLDSDNDLTVEVEPCKDCLEEQAKTSHQEGYDEGYEIGSEGAAEK